VVQQKRCKQSGEVDEREAKCFACQCVRVFAPQPPCIRNESQAQHGGSHQIQPRAHTKCEGHQTCGHQQKGVEQNLQACEFIAVRDGQHRKARLAVVLHPVKRQGPKVRWCPQKNDQKKNQRFRADLARHGGPPKHRWHGARGAANDDVLRREGFQNDGVHHCVANESGKGQPHGEWIDQDKQHS